MDRDRGPTSAPHLTGGGQRIVTDLVDAVVVALNPAMRQFRRLANPSEHEYIVTVDDGVPSSFTCPADANYAGP
ncbi:hypothetical protein [Haloarchaeobius sp. TZWWS8]|uniref:hypothetical protein n=1 Tax=Haloarchaeobius sp. TZWWS8 TaxID=3446121 RepID=UPI003EBB3938